MPAPTIVLFGRTNVGKSTLFNRLTEAREALVSPLPGTTRDYKEGEMLWRGQTYRVIDTGGVEILGARTSQRSPTLSMKIRDKITLALKKADLILFLIDAKHGIMAVDRELLKVARTFRRPIILVANKSDNNALRAEVAALTSLVGQSPIPVSAVNGSGIGDMLDHAMSLLSKAEERRDKTEGDQESTNADIVVTILGKPNVGKSTLLNAILGEERVIVDARPHTTREPIDTVFRYKEKLLKITDTAGIRRHVGPHVEKAGVERTLIRLRKTDVAVLLFDPFAETLTHQDRALAGVVKEGHVATILVANKYDLAPTGSSEVDRGVIIGQFERQLRDEFPFFSFAPLLTISAHEKWRVTKLLDLVLHVDEEKRKTLDAETLKTIFKEIGHELGMTRVRTRRSRRETPKLASLKQTHSNPPGFAIATARHAKIPFSIVKIAEKHIRAVAGFTGVPMKIHIERK